MIDPKSGGMTMLGADEMKQLGSQMQAEKMAAATSVMTRIAQSKGAENMGPAEELITFTEGEVVEIRGCYFRVIHIRPSRVSLKPISRREAQEGGAA